MLFWPRIVVFFFHATWQTIFPCTIVFSDNCQQITFLETNDNLIICPVDKSKDLIIFEKDVYLKKLSEVFEPSKFRKLNHNSVNVDFEALRKVIAEFRPHSACAEAYKMKPIEI